MSKPTTLYRLYAADEELLYVGIAGNPGRRFEQHRKDKQWWGDVANIQLEHHTTRDSASKAERNQIQTLRPKYNIVHNKPIKSKKSRDVTNLVDVVCTSCNAVIVGDGYLEVDDGKAMHQHMNPPEPDIVYEKDDVRLDGFSGGQLLDWPAPVSWEAYHWACDPDIEAGTYWIEVDRIATYADVLDWTAHLMEKNWFNETDWSDLLRNVANGVPRGPLRVAGVTPPPPDQKICDHIIQALRNLGGAAQSFADLREATQIVGGKCSNNAFRQHLEHLQATGMLDIEEGDLRGRRKRVHLTTTGAAA